MIVEAKKVLVKPRPLQKPTNMGQTQQIIVLPSNLLLNSKGGQETVLRLSKSPPVMGTKIVLPPQNKINVIKAIKRPVTPTSPEQENQDQMSATPRKRANLDHMTPEEKMMRRKLKNRVAAQNARDKKRLKMDEMEEKLKHLEDENKRISQENSNLIALNKRLMEENQALTSSSSTLPPSPPPSELAPSSPAGSCLSSVSSHDQSLVEQRSVVSAEPINVSQQKRQDLCLAGDQRAQLGLFWTCLMMSMAPAALSAAVKEGKLPPMEQLEEWAATTDKLLPPLPPKKRLLVNRTELCLPT